MIRKSIILAVVPLFLVACGGGGEGGGSGGDVGAGGDGTGINGCGASATPGGSGGVGAGGPSGAFQIAGQLNVEESNKVEVECNNSVAGAAAIAPGESYDGQAKSTNAGYKGITARSEAVIHDLYRLDASSENVRVTLSFSDEKTTSNASSPLKSDLDLFLLDSTGKTVVASSEGTDQTIETVTTPGPGVYYIGVRAFEGDSPYLLAAGTTTTTTALDRATVLPGREFVAGDVLVKQKDTTANKAMAATHQLAMVSELGDGVRLMHVAKPANLGIASAATKEKPNAKINAPGHEDNEAIGATLEALLRLKKDSNIAYAEPNFIRHTNIVPNDQYYQYQWHYRAINLESAWVDTTRGDGVIVAVIDTGVKSAHPDLAGQLVAGYDFISDSANAGDGNGIDSNPEDVGDGARAGESSFHGTHVAGTIAAASNNGTGVAGIAWNAKIMPLRVLGKRGGTDADIVQAIRYAARLSNSSLTLPAIKADIVNMSLGGPSFSNTVQQAVTDARAQGVIVVAAAGNENSSAPSYPAAYDGVISVSAVGYDRKRAPYSNYANINPIPLSPPCSRNDVKKDSKIDLAAPGGDTSVDRNGDGFADGVLSTLYDDTAQKFSYVFYQGTSMAAPHVAGVLALMRGVNHSISPAVIDALIAGTHKPYPQRITTDLGEFGCDPLYGHGLIDAKKALDAAIALAGSGSAAGSVLNTSATQLIFDRFTQQLDLTITNGGDGVSNVTSVTADQPWLSVSPSSGVAPMHVTVTIDRAKLNGADGNVHIVTDASSGPSLATITVPLPVVSSSNVGDVGDIFVIAVNPANGETVNTPLGIEAIPGAANKYRYAISGLPPGFYYIYAGTDRDNDDFICEIEDACGTFGALVEVKNGVPLTNLNFSVNNSQNPPPPGDVITSNGFSLNRGGISRSKGIRRK